MYKLIGILPTRTFRVVWTLEELGQPYEFITAPPQSNAVLALNPSGKVPALVTDEGVLLDSVAIMQYLADKHGQLTFPAGSFHRGQQDSLTQFINDELDAALWAAARNSFVLPEDKRVPEIKETLKWEFARSLSVLESRLGAGDYLIGDRFTIPDILLTHCLRWSQIAKFDPFEGTIATYFDRMTTRPAFQKTAGQR